MMRSFVDHNKQRGRILDPRSSPPRADSTAFADDLEFLLRLLDQYAASFTRTALPDVREAMEKMGHQYTKRFKFLPREMMLNRLRMRLESPHLDYQFDLKIIFKIIQSIIDDLDAQYLEIRAARKQLFAWDVLHDRMCNIDVEEWRQDEMVDWNTDKPIDAGHL